MKTFKNIKLLGISLLLVTGLAACDNPGPAEAAGKRLDTAANNTGTKIDLTLDKAGDQFTESSDRLGVAMDDTEITTKVKSAIFSEPGLKTLRISVDTIKGVVTLTGSVDSQSDFDRTSELAASVKGVREVENYIRVTPAR